ncbi:hypothetical protein F8762_07790 [Salmonella enterica]|nr:hypothetical protein CGA23_09655 [Salmonella enterica subsp. enterica]EAA2696006.1 hypothetical protein [Salmonella enterica]EAA8033862.1 hypothetical protein [Salmonella enterica subsp. enterica serovar Duisburg]ECH8182146.1 hypothetical protein [Salmonella enterica subsp. enterica serovar Rissen]ECL7193689.1 hypothetical protein [Salmonella enterica subsp. enterica serovar Muenchen]EEJ6872094.1 hypothetical protein [Salmonella enterica subsp. houtenae]
MRHSALLLIGEALTYHLLRVDRLEPRLNRNVFRGFRFSGLRVIPPTGKSKAPAHTLPLYPSCSKPRIAIARLFLFPAGIFYFPACIVTKSNYL